MTDPGSRTKRCWLVVSKFVPSLAGSMIAKLAEKRKQARAAVIRRRQGYVGQGGEK